MGETEQNARIYTNTLPMSSYTETSLWAYWMHSPIKPEI